ncbi:hypothetical protein R3W88_004236 [Solanum pinnatisectum]|uniref:Uncharacterized protein n=1 Tax=Solanum pinnatisectum TaxID=50273 RepID=A0AAV9KA12_9SOLN|nr:hypothetical protein R3W88_004236 [Solanum pinnatisectum]
MCFLCVLVNYDERKLCGCNSYVDDQCSCSGRPHVRKSCVDASQDDEMWDKVGMMSQTWLMSTNVRTNIGVCDAPLEMVKNSELESQDEAVVINMGI